MRQRPTYHTGPAPDAGQAAQHLPPAALPEPLPPAAGVGRPVVTLDRGGIGDALCALAAATGAGADFFPPANRAGWVELFADDPAVEWPLSLDEYDHSGRAVPRWEWWAGRLGAAAKLPQPKPLPADALEWAVAYAGRIVLAPYAAAPNRTWPRERWLELERLLRAAGLSVVVLADRNEDVSAFTSDRLVGETPARVAAVIKYCECFVGNDSGLTHVAGFLRVPAVALVSHASDHNIFGLYPTVRELGGERWAGFVRVTADQVARAVDGKIREAAGDFPRVEFGTVIAEHDHARTDAQPCHWLTTYPALWRTLRRIDPRRIVEIGSRAGYSAWTMVHACPDAAIEAFDADLCEHGGYVGAHEHARRINPGRYTLTIADSHTLDKLPPCDLAYVDGDHSEDGAYADLELCERSGVPLVLVDDVALLPPVKAAADRFCRERSLRPEFIPSRTGLYLIDLAKRNGVLILSAATPGYDPDGLVAANHRRFGELTGQRQEFHTAGFDDSRPPAWSKIPLILSALDRSPLVFWLDADAVFCRPADLSDFADEGKDLVVCADHNGVNTGAMLIRSCDWSRAFLRRVWDLGDDPRFRDHPWWDQAPINHLVLVDDEARAHVRILPARAFNSQPCSAAGFADGDLVAHFPGLPWEDKRDRLAEYAARLG